MPACGQRFTSVTDPLAGVVRVCRLPDLLVFSSRLMIAHSHLAHLGDQTQHDLASARTTARRQT